MVGRRWSKRLCLAGAALEFGGDHGNGAAGGAVLGVGRVRSDAGGGGLVGVQFEIGHFGQAL